MRRAHLWWHLPLRSGCYKLSSRGVCAFLALSTFIDFFGLRFITPYSPLC